MRCRSVEDKVGQRICDPRLIYFIDGRNCDPPCDARRGIRVTALTDELASPAQPSQPVAMCGKAIVVQCVEKAFIRADIEALRPRSDDGEQLRSGKPAWP